MYFGHLCREGGCQLVKAQRWARFRDYKSEGGRDFSGWTMPETGLSREVMAGSEQL